MKTIHVTDEESRSAAQAAIALTAPPFTVVIGGGWQPIDDDAKDGSPVDLWFDCPRGPVHDVWWDGGWVGFIPDGEPTHYRREVGPNG